MVSLKISKAELNEIINKSIYDYIITDKINKENEEPEETLFIGIDINGDLIYTEKSLYIPFSTAVFFQEINEEFLHSILDIEDYNFSTEKNLNYIKEIIELRFKKKNTEVFVSFF